MAKKKSEFTFGFHVWKEEEHTINVSVVAQNEEEAKKKLTNLVDLSLYQSILKEITESKTSGDK